VENTNCGRFCGLVADSYWEVLLTMIRRFKIAKANEKVELKMKVARMLPFTENQDQVEALMGLIR
jgi:hypothetical protein